MWSDAAVLPQIPRVAGEYDLKAPRDMAYVFSGAYTPLSCKIVEQVPAKTPAGERELSLCRMQLLGWAECPGHLQHRA